MNSYMFKKFIEEIRYISLRSFLHLNIIVLRKSWFSKWHKNSDSGITWSFNSIIDLSKHWESECLLLWPLLTSISLIFFVNEGFMSQYITCIWILITYWITFILNTIWLVLTRSSLSYLMFYLFQRFFIDILNWTSVTILIHVTECPLGINSVFSRRIIYITPLQFKVIRH